MSVQICVLFLKEGNHSGHWEPNLRPVVWLEIRISFGVGEGNSAWKPSPPRKGFSTCLPSGEGGHWSVNRRSTLKQQQSPKPHTHRGLEIRVGWSTWARRVLTRRVLGYFLGTSMSLKQNLWHNKTIFFFKAKTTKTQWVNVTDGGFPTINQTIRDCSTSWCNLMRDWARPPQLNCFWISHSRNGIISVCCCKLLILR